ncbi:alpha-2C adrenergic receptor-like [Diabrotica undecimpunctata]|uniref:alpha-2C adrenergic receptor-like n=1 Tax=Diabrotica undecimpunctata TaxID=50387 RepID=UPI003B63A352
MITDYLVPEIEARGLGDIWFQQDGATCHTARKSMAFCENDSVNKLFHALDQTKMSLETPTSTTQLPVCFEDMYYQCEVDDINGNFTNHTVSVPHYPSGYTITQIAVASIVVTVLMIVIVVGNMLVIIAISTEKALKNIQNWFIASLAVSDFFLGLIIMPFSLANELMGYWVFGLWWCEVHSAMDVLLSTASIMNLCLISLDRYWSITQAVEYLKKRTPVRAIVMIAAVWVLSALICIPPLLGWKVARPKDEQYPKCQFLSKRELELEIGKRHESASDSYIDYDDNDSDVNGLNDCILPDPHNM